MHLRWQQGPLTEINANFDPEELKSLDKGIKGIIINLQEDAYFKPDESQNIIKLIRQAKDLQIKTIIDLDPSTSELWFTETDGGNHSEYYIWRPPKQINELLEPPNNWVRFILCS